jgi:putative ABC transport system permease protein
VGHSSQPSKAGRFGRRIRSRAGRPFRRLSALAAPPWARAPLLLLRFPALLLAVATASVILAVASASSPLFLSSAGNGALRNAIAQDVSLCPWTLGLQVTTFGSLTPHQAVEGPFPSGEGGVEEFQARDAALRHSASSVPRLGPPVITIVGSTVSAARVGAPGTIEPVRLMARDGGLAHVTVLERTSGQGVWITDTTSRVLKLHAGGSIVLSEGKRTAQVPVVGVYRDMERIPPTSYWCTMSPLIYPPNAFSNFNPPPLLLADRSVLVPLGEQLGDTGTQFTWEFLLEYQNLSLAEARSASGGIQGIQNQVQVNDFANGPPLFGFNTFTNSELVGLVQQSNGVVDSIRGSVDAVSLAGRLVALVVIAAAGAYWVDRRRIEVALLAAKGTGPFAIAVKMVLESLPAVVVGGVIGWLVATGLVKVLGPTRFIDAGASSSAMWQILWTGLIGLALLGIVGGVTALRSTEGSPIRGAERLARAPWEVLVLALAGASLYEILTRGTAPVQAGTNAPAKVDVLLLLFPILFIAGLAGLASRGVRRLLPWARAVGSRRGPVLYFTTRRLAGASGIALALVTASALAVGILAYAGALTASVTATSHAKAEVATGSDAAVAFPNDPTIPSGLRAATKVTRIEGLIWFPSQQSVAGLAIDRQTFARGAYWDRGFADRSLPDLLRLLAPPSSGPIPVLIAGGDVPARGSLLSVGAASASNEVNLPVRVVATVKAFPGQQPNTPLVVIDQDAAARGKLVGVVWLWAKGDPRQTFAAVQRAGLPTLAQSSVQDVQQQTPDFLALSWAFAFLKALGIMTGLIALGGVLLYLEARQRQREISYVLSRRMGLTRGAHRLSVALELAGMLLIAFVIGSVLAAVAARVISGKLDPLPVLPPAPVFRLPLPSFGLTALALLLAAVVGAWRVQRAADRAAVSEVMRLAV